MSSKALRVLSIAGIIVLSFAVFAACGGSSQTPSSTVAAETGTALPGESTTPTATLTTPVSPTVAGETPVAEPAEPSQPEVTDQLPKGAELRAESEVDLMGDGSKQRAIIFFYPPSDTVNVPLAGIAVFDADGKKLWQSEPLLGERSEGIEVGDINKDGHIEMISVQSMGAAGETLYVLQWNGNEFGFLSPVGGEFDGRGSFGDNGARVEDLNGDGVQEIIGAYGPAASSQDIYQWSQGAYVYSQTIHVFDEGQVDNAITSGTVLSVSASSQVITIRPDTGTYDTVALVEGTLIIFERGGDASLSDIVPGAVIKVNGTLSAKNTVIPSVITIVGK